MCKLFPYIFGCRLTFGGKRRFACPNKQTAKQFAGLAKCGGTKPCRGQSPNTFLWSLAAQRAAYFYRFVMRRNFCLQIIYLYSPHPLHEREVAGLLSLHFLQVQVSPYTGFATGGGFTDVMELLLDEDDEAILLFKEFNK